MLFSFVGGQQQIGENKNAGESLVILIAMPPGRYNARHIARWSVSVASCEAPKRRHQASARAVSARRTPSSSTRPRKKKHKTQVLLASDYRTFLLVKAI